MKRFRFRLERVLKLKQQRERLAALAQARAVTVVNHSRQQVAVLRDELTATARAVASQLGQAIPCGSWLRHYEHAARLAAGLQAAEKRVQEASARLQEACLARVRAATEVETLTTLERSERAEHGRSMATGQQVDLNEHIMRRYGRPREQPIG